MIPLEMLVKIRDIIIITILSFALLEGALRLILFSDLINIPSLQQAWRYVDSDTDDSWKLQYIWGKQWAVSSSHRIHPSLGWSQTKVTTENPLGLQDDTLEMLRPDGRNKVLFYGDSFVKGASDPEYHIPKYMNERTPAVDIIDLGVPGYGTDQIFLLFKETYSKVKHPLIVMGVLWGDIDRTVLSFRTSQKPYLIVDSDGALITRGVPIEPDQRSYVESHPPGIKSYALSLIFTKFNLFKSNNEPRKKQVNSRIIEDTKSIADNNNIPLLYVIFYGFNNLENVDWRQTFLKTELEKYNIPFVDTKTFLISHAKQNNLPLSAYYVENEGHHNNLGNEVIAQAILKELADGCKKWRSNFCSFEIGSIL